MKRRFKFLAAIASLLVFILAVSSCGGSSATSSASADYDTATEEVVDEGYEMGAYGAQAEAKSYDSNEAAEETMATADTADTANTAGTANGGKEPEAVEAAESNQKLVYTCWMTIQTLEFANTQASVKDAVKKVGGIIECESVSDSNYKWYYDSYSKRSGTLTSSLTIRVPSAKYEEFLTLLDGVGGKITSKSQNVENITKRYNDQTIYIESLEKQEARLLEMMEQAETVEEMITVEARLTDVQTELNQARSSLATMDTDVKYSTVNLSLEEVVMYTNTPATPLSFGQRVADAFVDSWENFIDLIQNVIISLIYLLPVLLLIAVIAGIVIFINRAWRKKHPKPKKEKKPNPRAYNNRGFFRGPGKPMNGQPGAPMNGQPGNPMAGQPGSPMDGQPMNPTDGQYGNPPQIEGNPNNALPQDTADKK